jgi:hypothetical protein
LDAGSHLAILARPHGAGAAEALVSLRVDLDQTSVSGLSSGAYMAGRLHVAFSGGLKEAAIIAGGPYGCSKGRLTPSQCAQTTLFGAPDPEAPFARAQGFEEDGRIDPLANLLDDRVCVFSGAPRQSGASPQSSNDVADRCSQSPAGELGRCDYP